MLAASGHRDVAGASLEYRRFGPSPKDAPTLVLLHEGLGCVGLWGTFPAKLAEVTGLGVVAWSRAGYGASSPVALPRPLDYMHHEAREMLPALLDAIGFREGLLVGHSDGASIAAIHAGEIRDPRVRGLCLMAPHFIVEDISITSIAEAKLAYETGDLKAKLARWHQHVDCAFLGWNGAWLDPGFRDWDISAFLETIAVPVLILQGAEDQYGTVRQLEIARERCRAPLETVLLPAVKHSPHREAEVETLRRIGDFARAVWPMAI